MREGFTLLELAVVFVTMPLPLQGVFLPSVRAVPVGQKGYYLPSVLYNIDKKIDDGMPKSAPPSDSSRASPAKRSPGSASPTPARA